MSIFSLVLKSLLMMNGWKVCDQQIPSLTFSPILKQSKKNPRNLSRNRRLYLAFLEQCGIHIAGQKFDFTKLNTTFEADEADALLTWNKDLILERTWTNDRFSLLSA